MYCSSLTKVPWNIQSRGLRGRAPSSPKSLSKENKVAFQHCSPPPLPCSMKDNLILCSAPMTLTCLYFNSLTGMPSDYQVRETKPPQGTFVEMCPLEQSHHTLNSNYWVMQTLHFFSNKSSLFLLLFLLLFIYTLTHLWKTEYIFWVLHY